MTNRLLIGACALLAMMSASAAQALDLCKLASATSYAEASSMLEAKGCTVSGEEGTSRRVFDCPNDSWATVTNDAMALGILVPGAAADSLDMNCDGEAWKNAPEHYDNPLIGLMKATGFSSQSKRIVPLSLGRGTPALVWVCAKGYGCSGYAFETQLKAVLKRSIGDDTLTFSQSEIRIAGLDITQAGRADLQQAFTSRGAFATPGEDDKLIGQMTFTKVEGVPGLNMVEVALLGDRIVSVRYAIATQADYTSFYKALDERYGASSPRASEGCTDRLWTNGGVQVLGEFCAGKPDKSGFTFFNTGALNIASAVIELTKEQTPEAPPRKTPPRARTDMY